MLLQGSLKFPPTPVAKSVESVGVCRVCSRGIFKGPVERELVTFKTADPPAIQNTPKRDI